MTVMSGTEWTSFERLYLVHNYDDTERRSVYQNVQYITWSKTGVVNFITVKYSLH